MDIYLNGRMIPMNAAKVAVNDAGLQHGVGLFETMAAYHGKAFRLDAHLHRLRDSAVALGLARTLDLAPLRRAVEDVLTHNKLQRARVRLTVTPGAVSLLSPTSADTTPQPTILAVATEPTEYDPAYFDRGITVVVAPAAANPFDPLAGHKTLAYWARLRTLRQAAIEGAGEAIWLNISNHLASGAVSNLFIVKDGELLTPLARGEEVEGALNHPVLPGITRAAVLEIAARLDLPNHRHMLAIHDLLDADEVFLTNASWLILPVTRVEKKPIAQGGVGPITTTLRTALLELIENETSGGANPKSQIPMTNDQ